MVEALGYRVDRLFVGVFMAGSALAGLGGAMMAFYRGQVHATIGGEFLVLCFIVIIIGGLGSVGGSFVASILVALIANYAGFLAPKLALVSNILAMVAVLLVAAARALSGERAMNVLSGDPPRGRALQILLVLIILALIAAPFLFPGREGAQCRRQDLRDDPARRLL